MKVYVVGHYRNEDREQVFRELSDWHRREIITDVLSGGENTGTDLYACQWAAENNIGYCEYRPRWDQYGNDAALRRNLLMYSTEKPDLILAFQNARGTEQLRELCETGKTIFKVASLE